MAIPKPKIAFHIHMPFTFWRMCRHYMCADAHAHVCIVRGLLTEGGEPML